MICREDVLEYNAKVFHLNFTQLAQLLTFSFEHFIHVKGQDITCTSGGLVPALAESALFESRSVRGIEFIEWL